MSLDGNGECKKVRVTSAWQKPRPFPPSRSASDEKEDHRCQALTVTRGGALVFQVGGLGSAAGRDVIEVHAIEVGGEVRPLLQAFRDIEPPRGVREPGSVLPFAPSPATIA